MLLPCAPATANTLLPSKINGKASLRDKHSIPRFLASRSSTLSPLIAALYTTKSGSSIAVLQCGTVIFIPLALSSLVIALSAISEPLIIKSRSFKNLAIAEIPIPPIPIK